MKRDRDESKDNERKTQVYKDGQKEKEEIFSNTDRQMYRLVQMQSEFEREGKRKRDRQTDKETTKDKKHMKEETNWR